MRLPAPADNTTEQLVSDCGHYGLQGNPPDQHSLPTSHLLSCSVRANIEHLLNNDDTIITGVINAHNNLWRSALAEDTLGDDIAEQINYSTVFTDNDHSKVQH